MSGVGFIASISLVMFTIYLVMQVAVFGYARHVAHTAARQAATLAAVEDSSGRAGQSYGTDFVNRAAGSWVKGTSVTVSRGTEFTSATVTGRALEIIPVPWDLNISVRSDVPTERFVAADE